MLLINYEHTADTSVKYMKAGSMIYLWKILQDHSQNVSALAVKMLT